PAQYGTSIQAVATYLVEGQSVPYARASQLLQEWLGVQLSVGSIASFVKTCHQQLAEVETSHKTALVKAKVSHQEDTGQRVGTECRSAANVELRVVAGRRPATARMRSTAARRLAASL